MSRPLVEKARAGDREAFGELVRLYSPIVTGALLARLGAGDDVDDPVQETFLRALKNLDALRDPDRFGAWVYGIAVNVARELRSRPRAVPFEETSAPEPPEPDAHGLRTCLDRIPQTLRELFILRHIDGLSYRTLADLRGMSIPSVGERLWKARRLLRECLGRHAP